MLGVAPREIVVDSDDMNWPAHQAGRDRRQQRRQCLAFAGFHFGERAAASSQRRRAAEQGNGAMPRWRRAASRANANASAAVSASALPPRQLRRAAHPRARAAADPTVRLALFHGPRHFRRIVAVAAAEAQTTSRGDSCAPGREQRSVHAAIVAFGQLVIGCRHRYALSADGQPLDVS